MNDSFNFGKPANRGPQINLDPRLMIGLVVLAVVAVAAFFAMKFFASSGEQIADVQKTVVQQVDRSKDVLAQSNLQQALTAARVAFADSTSYVNAGPAQLSAIEPSFQYTDGPSTAPNVVSVAATADSWSGAVMADSGTCFWLRTNSTGATTYGQGTPCTGAAAAGASAPSW